ncbi:hypothetical protein Efla_002666 [Eimeria flavescens]
MVDDDSFFFENDCSTFSCEEVTFNGWKTLISRTKEHISFFLRGHRQTSIRMPEGHQVGRPAVFVADIVQSDKQLTPSKVEVEGDTLMCDGKLQREDLRVLKGTNKYCDGLIERNGPQRCPPRGTLIVLVARRSLIHASSRRALHGQLFCIGLVSHASCLQVDFAGKYVGGLSIFGNHVAQEELMFA